MDLFNAETMGKLDLIKNQFKDYKLYQLNKDETENIQNMFMEFIEDNYDYINDSLKGIDDLDIMNSEDYSESINLCRMLNEGKYVPGLQVIRFDDY